jgi:hypothetical protein
LQIEQLVQNSIDNIEEEYTKSIDYAEFESLVAVQTQTSLQTMKMSQILKQGIYVVIQIRFQSRMYQLPTVVQIGQNQAISCKSVMNVGRSIDIKVIW